MRYIGIFLFLVLAMSVTATIEDANLGIGAAYITLVEDDAPASDVVNAANFAASMIATGATFTAMTVTEARTALTQEGVENSLLVLFDGELVTLYEGTREGIAPVAGSAILYLEGKNFSVASVGPLFQVHELAPVTPPAAPEEAPIQEPEEEPEPELLPREEPEPIAAPEESAPAIEEDVEDIPEDVPEEEPSIFVRVWHWFITLF